jgi:Xaa-Pro aminopeptidase
MDVHDVGAYYVDGSPRPLAREMVLTIEPGIYIALDDDQAPAEYRGIGVRIEDDILITESGNEVLTEAVPKSADEVERACQG